jgi:predicted permease
MTPEDDLKDEIQTHLDLLAEEHERRGLSSEEARLAARRDFGGVEQMKEAYRDQRGFRWIDSLVRDVRYAIRLFRKAPVFTAVAVFSLALGIGANTAVFTLLDALLLRTLSVRDSHELVEVTAQKHGEFAMISFPMYRDLRNRQDVFGGFLATAGETPYRVTIPDSAGSATELDNIPVSLVSGNYFEVLGVPPALGRFFTADDDRNPHSSEALGSVVVLSDAFWERQFGRDPRILERTISIGRSPCRVIGIAPHGFSGEVVGSSPAAWVPLVPFSSDDNLENRRGVFTAYMARLKPGVDRVRAQAAMTVLFQQLLRAEGRIRDHTEDFTIALADGATGLDVPLRRTFARPIRIVMAIVAVVLLIACANVANLLLARGAARQAEFGVRLAIGCSRRQLVAQVLTESVILSALGAFAGAAIAYAGSGALLGLISTGPAPVALDLQFGVRVFAFLAVVAIGSAVAFGLLPALRMTRVDPGPVLKRSLRAGLGGPAQRASRSFVSLQMALSLLLLIGAGLLLRSLQNLHRLDLGFRADHVLVFDLAHTPQQRDPASLSAVGSQVLRRIRQLPNVESASVSGLLLFSRSDIGAPLRIVDYTPRTDERVTVRYNAVSPGYLETIGMPLIDGRSIEDRDAFDAPMVAVINESMARRYFYGTRPIGRPMAIDVTRADSAPPAKVIEIIGVVRDAKYNSFRQDTRPMFYVPIAQLPRSLRSLEVRTSQPASAMATQVRQALAEVTKDIMIRRVLPLTEQVDQSLAAERLTMRLCSFFGGLALVLACVGLYGVMAYAVAQRTAEIGVRMALGANATAVVWLVFRETTHMILLGVAIGLPLALASTRLLSGFLYGLTATDPATIAIATACLVAAAALSAYIPARRATRVDPLVALRAE